jgi:hypothetical protein
MEKNIASVDLSDMMVYEGMDKQSRRFEFKQQFAFVGKTIDATFRALERVFKGRRARSRESVLQFADPDFSDTATVVYSITIASVLISFFWLTLLLSPNL